MTKNEVFVVMVVIDPHGNKCPDKDIAFWAKRLKDKTDQNGTYIHRCNKEVAKADARKFTALSGFKYEAVQCTVKG